MQKYEGFCDGIKFLIEMKKNYIFHYDYHSLKIKTNSDDDLLLIRFLKSYNVVVLIRFVIKNKSIPRVALECLYKLAQ